MKTPVENIRESSLYKRFAKECQTIGIAPSTKILLAVSGGIDSTVMATLFWAAGYKFSIAHVNFKLRGDDSFADQQFVREWAEKHSVQIFEKEADTIEYAKTRGLSVEMAAREIRYEFFYKTAEREQIKYIAVAHNADDNAETLLLNLTRGTGLKGLCAISEHNAISDNLVIIRPLLFAQRVEIEQFAGQFGITHREDKTNKENEYKRNKIRNQIIPLLKELNPSVIKTLNEDISHFKQSYAFEKENVEKAMNESLRKKIEGMDFLGLREKYLLAAVDLGKMPRSKHVLCSFLGYYGFSYSVAEDIAAAAENVRSAKENVATSCSSAPSHTTKIFTSPASVAALERGLIKIYKGEILKDADALKDVEVAVPSAGEWVVNFATDGSCLKRYKLTVSEKKTAGAAPSHTLCLDSSAVNFPLTLRTLRPGDVFSPFGLKGSKNAADFIGDKKIDTLIKPLVMALCDCNGKILCLPGLEIDNSMRIGSTTEKILCISLLAE